MKIYFNTIGNMHICLVKFEEHYNYITMADTYKSALEKAYRLYLSDIIPF